MDRARLHEAIIEAAFEKAFPEDVGPPRRGGCYLLALAIRDALATIRIVSELRQDLPTSPSHVVVALGSHRLDCRGAWPLSEPPEDLPHWNDVPMDPGWWGDQFDDRTFREDLTTRLRESFARHGVRAD